jgi:NADH:ubiquinone reductase (H+-translocating)
VPANRPARHAPGRPAGAQHRRRALGQGERKPFTFKTLGMVVDLGRRQAVAKILGVKLRGFPAWFCARTYHLMAIPGIRRRIRLVIEWTVELFFRRDSAEWIPARLPRLSLAAVRDPEAVEFLVKSASAEPGERPPSG